MDGEYWTADGDEALAQFAAAIGVDAQSALWALGGGWNRCEVGGGEWPADRWSQASWFVTGEPGQVLIGVDHAALVLARPVIRWSGHRLVIAVEDAREFAREDVSFQPELLADAVQEIARRSRRTFRWCRLCRTLNPPGHMLDREECQGCAEKYRGVVH